MDETHLKEQMWKYAHGLKPLEVFPVPKELNPFGKRVEIVGISASHIPGGAKAVAARGLLAYAKIHGKLDGVNELVEATSGNTGLALALQARNFNIPNVTLIVPPDIPAPKRTRLLLAGARVMFPERNVTPVAMAKELGGRWSQNIDDWKPVNGRLNLGQYDNPGNPLFHEVWTGTQILHLLGNVDFLAISLGTGGTAIGVRNHLRKHTNVSVIGVACAPGNEVPGARDKKRLAEGSLPWRESIDVFEEVGQKQAYAAACWLNQIAGQPVGPSGGMAFVGLLRALKRLESELPEKTTLLKAAFFVPDGPEVYAERFEANLPSRFFSGYPEFPLPWDSIFGEWNL